MTTFRLRPGREINTNPKCKYWYYLATERYVPQDWRDNPPIEVKEEELPIYFHRIYSINWSKITRNFVNKSKIMKIKNPR